MNPETFKEWACSLSGCDGGNFYADTWLCGIEWGAGSQDNGIYYKTQLLEEMTAGKAHPPCDRFDWNESLSYPYGRSFAKLYAAIHGEKVQSYKYLAANTWDGSELFKLNLYPIAFDSTDESLWEKNNLHQITGFDEKHLFQTWCFLNRFPAFSALRKNRSPRPPKLIIGTGISYLRDFIMCFGWDQGTCGSIRYGDIEPSSESNKKNKRRYYWVSLDSFTTLMVVPFFSGTYGLNSDYLLQEMGQRIKAILNEEAIG